MGFQRIKINMGKRNKNNRELQIGYLKLRKDSDADDCDSYELPIIVIFILHSFFPISHSSSSSSLGPHLIRKFVMGMGSSLLGPTEDFHVYPQQTV
ncbi:hypothetical protein Csa_020098 [Cucumis sativus]|uniref:Uncharacterized protein n=1 Tax=Cucumis sativus TaxID=3659 RepID=A0A0A0LWR7_CUCSA|nr:hypothetical protein Csa_020098 [Cucumis sativus]